MADVPPSASSSRSIWTLIGVETMCLLGSEISRFGVSVWIYQATQSVGAFAALLLANTVPGMIASPFAGSIVDRSSRKRVMIAAATVSLLGTLIVLSGALLGELSMPIVVAGACLASIGDAFQWPALSATIPLMSSDADLPAYNGFLESGRAASMLAGPPIGGFLLAFLGLPGLVAIELVTFTLATIVVASMVIPRPSAPEVPEGADAEPPLGLLADSLSGMRWIIAHRPLLKFLLVATFANFFISIGMVIMPPYGLSFLGERAYGITSGLFGAGMIVGGVAFGVLSKRWKSIQQFLASAVVLGVIYVAYGFARDLWMLGALNLLIAVMMTIGNASIMTVWQLKVPDELQGRVLSTMRLVANLTIPVSFLLAAPLTDHVAPFVLAHSGVADLFGDSKTAVMGAMFSAIGVVMIVGFVLASMVREVRQVEDLAV